MLAIDITFLAVKYYGERSTTGFSVTLPAVLLAGLM